MIKKIGMLLICAGVATASVADAPGDLSGVWMLDAVATEKSIVNGVRPKETRQFVEFMKIVGGYLPLFTYEFDGDNLVAGALRGNKRIEYRFASQQGVEVKYLPSKPAEVGDLVLLVVRADNGAIRIAPPHFPDMTPLLWKRVQLKPEQATDSDVQDAMEAWAASGATIMKVLAESAK